MKHHWAVYHVGRSITRFITLRPIRHTLRGPATPLSLASNQGRTSSEEDEFLVYHLLGSQSKTFCFDSPHDSLPFHSRKYIFRFISEFIRTSQSPAKINMGPQLVQVKRRTRAKAPRVRTGCNTWCVTKLGLSPPPNHPSGQCSQEADTRYFLFVSMYFSLYTFCSLLYVLRIFREAPPFLHVDADCLLASTMIRSTTP